jgi:DNA-binding HxlR family transcriptional regulator
MKRYAQACTIARSLDVVGERWNLLLVRELLLGPRRHRDLAAGLPGIPSNLLAARLKDLQAAGIVVRRTLPAPADVAVYELTDAGRALQPALTELLAWGQRYAPEPAPDDAVQPSWAMLAGIGRPSALPQGQTCELRIEDETFYLSSDGGRAAVRRWPAPHGDVVVTMSADTLYSLMTGQATATEVLGQGTVEGEAAIAFDALEPFAGMGLEHATAS